MDRNENETVKNPRQNANFFSILTFSWAWKTFLSGYHRDFTEEDLIVPLKDHSSRLLGSKLENAWHEENQRCNKNDEFRPSLLKVLIKCFGTEVMVVGFFQGINELVISMCRPFILGKVLSYFDEKNTMSTGVGLCWATAHLSSSIIHIIFNNHSLYALRLVEIKIQTALCSLIYRKIVRVSRRSLEAKTTIDQIMNLINNDVKSVNCSIFQIHYTWIVPIQLLIVAYMVCRDVNLLASGGILIFLLVALIQAYLWRSATRIAEYATKCTVETLRLTSEILNGIQLIKMSAWENHFYHLLKAARAQETKSIQKQNLLQNLARSCGAYVTHIALLLTLASFAKFQNPSAADTVYTVISYYYILGNGITELLAYATQRIGKAIASMKQIEEFMQFEEFSDHAKRSKDTHQTYRKISFATIEDFTPHNTPTSDVGVALNGESAKCSKNTDENRREFNFTTVNGDSASVIDQNTKPQIAVTLENATAKWYKDASDDTLKNINFSAKRGDITAIIGQVGAGKSSLFHAILQELPLNSGKLEVHGKVVYVSQEPWIFTSSVRQNILFGQSMNNERYCKVVRICQLEKDFIMFPNRDQTIIGERGINLSGGQRARINLARAIYTEADVYLLDDPLSAVDAHVGRWLFKECICDYLKGKTIILVTHQLQYLNSVDRVYVLGKGKVEFEGSIQELRSSSLDFLSVYQATVEGDRENKEADKDVKPLLSEVHSTDFTSELERKDIAEHRTNKKISSRVYWSYFKAVGSLHFVLLMFGLSILHQIAASGGDYFILYWINAKETSNIRSDFNYIDDFKGDYRLWYVYIYSGLIVATVISDYVKSFVFFKMCLRSSKNFHAAMFYNIIRATMSFFHANSSGRIIDRFSRDIGLVDKDLPLCINGVLTVLLYLVAMIIMTTIMNYWMLIPTIITGYVFYLLKSIYTKTSRNVKRLEGITRSPVISHLSATLQGLTTVRAFKAQERLTKEFDNYQDVHSASWFLFISGSRALSFCLDLICSIYMGIVIFLFLLMAGEKEIAKVGLIIMQSLQLSSVLQWGIPQAAELENEMYSVERILEYTKVPKEPLLESEPDKKPPPKWPTEGCVEFKNVCLRYSLGGEMALKNVSFAVKTKEKVGIVGRTGAGKSSLIAALFRLENMEGEVFIDGVHTGNLGLHDLRSRISIIPQEPLLFPGTLRENLDPFEEFTDGALWQALAEVQLKDAVEDYGLYGDITYGGANFTVGQRQLLCLARAIVRNNTILVLDEATDNMVPQTNGLLKQIIRKKFEKCTVFIIAHRLETVMDCDKLIVMDAGQVVEFGHPFLLLTKGQGYFYEMVQQTGSEISDVLIKIAESYYQNKRPSLAEKRMEREDEEEQVDDG